MKFDTQIFNISLNTLPILLHYFAKFKSSNLLQIRKKCKQNALHFYMHPFNVTRLLTYCLRTYNFSTRQHLFH